MTFPCYGVPKSFYVNRAFAAGKIIKLQTLLCQDFLKKKYSECTALFVWDNSLISSKKLLKLRKLRQYTDGSMLRETKNSNFRRSG